MGAQVPDRETLSFLVQHQPWPAVSCLLVPPCGDFKDAGSSKATRWRQVVRIGLRRLGAQRGGWGCSTAVHGEPPPDPPRPPSLSAFCKVPSCMLPRTPCLTAWLGDVGRQELKWCGRWHWGPWVPGQGSLPLACRGEELGAIQARPSPGAPPGFGGQGFLHRWAPG